MKQCMEFLITLFQLPVVNQLHKKEKQIYMKREKKWKEKKMDIETKQKEIQKSKEVTIEEEKPKPKLQKPQMTRIVQIKNEIISMLFKMICKVELII